MCTTIGFARQRLFSIMRNAEEFRQTLNRYRATVYDAGE